MRLLIKVDVSDHRSADHHDIGERGMNLYSNSDRYRAVMKVPLFLDFHYSSWLRETFVMSPPFVALVPPGNHKGKRESTSHNSVLPVSLS